MPVLIEACVDSLATAIAAEAGGADRIELCQHLDAGGITPSHGLISMVLEQVTIPVFVLVRPHEGPFTYNAADNETMRRDVKHARWLGAHGVVVGALTDDGMIDRDSVATLQDAAKDIPVTFHRAFDQAADPFAALDALIALGVNRVLTSGQAETAFAGRAQLAALVRQAAGRIAILAGGGIAGAHVAPLIEASGVTEIHLRATDPARLPGVRAAIDTSARALP